jgi:hypothetical protein
MIIILLPTLLPDSRIDSAKKVINKETLLLESNGNGIMEKEEDQWSAG